MRYKVGWFVIETPLSSLELLNIKVCLLFNFKI